MIICNQRLCGLTDGSLQSGAYYPPLMLPAVLHDNYLVKILIIFTDYKIKLGNPGS